MYDMIENMEAAAEAALDRLRISGTTIHCPSCNEPFDYMKEGGTTSPNPYAIPVCGKCFAAEFENTASADKPAPGNGATSEGGEP